MELHIDLNDVWNHLSLNDEEKKEIEIHVEDCGDLRNQEEMSLIERTYAGRYIGKEVVRDTSTFASSRDKDRILDWRSWLFDTNFFVLKSFDGVL